MKQMKRKTYLSTCLFLLVVLAFVVNSMLRVYSQVQEREYTLQLEALRDLSDHRAAIAESTLVGYLATLHAAADFLRDEDLHTEHAMEHLESVLEQEEMGFQRLGLADREGNARVTNGATLSITHRDYFWEALAGKSVISESTESTILDTDVFFVAVPVWDLEDHVQGVLYGAVETESFRLYGDICGARNTQIIDRNGAYILRQNGNQPVGQEGNFFDSLREIESSVPAEDIISQIQKGEPVLTEAHVGSREYAVYFAPLGMNDWYLVTGMEWTGISRRVDFLLGNDVYLLMVKVVGALVLLCAVIVYRLAKEKRYALDMYQRLKLNDEVIHMAMANTNAVILAYDVKADELRVINSENLRIPLPERVERPAQTLPELIPPNEKSQRQLEQIFNGLEHMAETADFDLFLDAEERHLSYCIHVRALRDGTGTVIQYVGVAEDVTETLLLKEKAERDYLTGLYNRQSGTERITHCLHQGAPSAQRVHAFAILDLDNFKNLNDTLGHQVGDRALRDVAEVLRHHFREYDTICRLAGDEFVVFLKDIPEEVIGRNMESLLKKLRMTYGTEGREVLLSVSAGVSVSPRDGADFQELYQKADKALYHAKKSGKRTFAVYRGE